MLKRRFKTIVGLTLLMFMSIGLTISTLHSHHHIEWNHSVDFVDTGNCLTSDTTVCPICGYLLQTDTPPALQSDEILFTDNQVVVEKDETGTDFWLTDNRGRSPPVLG